MLNKTSRDDSVDEVVSGALSDTPGEVLLVNPDTKTVRELLRQLRGKTGRPSVNLFADIDIFEGVTEDFLVASILADLRKEGAVEIRVENEMPHCALVLHESTVTSIIAAGDQIAHVSTEDADIVDEFLEFYKHRWKTAPEPTLRTPPLSEILESLESDVGADVAADFEAILASREAVVKGDNEHLGEVTVALLAAARNEVLQYDISRWGEYSGLASKATFSRTKNRLEDAGLLRTETVPIDVGRPRLRLLLDGELVDLPPAELADRAQTRLFGE